MEDSGIGKAGRIVKIDGIVVVGRILEAGRMWDWIPEDKAGREILGNHDQMWDSGIGKAGRIVKVGGIVMVGGMLEVGIMWRPDTWVGRGWMRNPQQSWPDGRKPNKRSWQNIEGRWNSNCWRKTGCWQNTWVGRGWKRNPRQSWPDGSWRPPPVSSTEPSPSYPGLRAGGMAKLYLLSCEDMLIRGEMFRLGVCSNKVKNGSEKTTAVNI